MSVIVPVRNRRALLEHLLESLAAQSYPDFEVVVVDDGSTDGSGEAAARRAAGGRAVRVVEGGGHGAVAARCRGVADARGEILAFTDSDCWADPDWLAAAVHHFDQGADVVHGRTRPERPTAPLERSIWAEEEGLYPTCNIFYRRSTYDELGGFDGTAGSRWGFRMERRAKGLGFGEDSLLAWRARREGYRVVFAPEALISHHVFPPDFVESLSRSWMMAAFPGLVREVPELRATLVHHRVVWGPRNRMPVYAVAAAVVCRRRLLVAAALAWWVAIRTGDLRRQPGTRAQRVKALPQEMVLDVVSTAGLCTGSLRHRLLLL